MNKPYNSFIQNLSISYECSLAIGNSLNLGEMLHEVIHTIVHKTNAHRGTIWLFKEREELHIGARAGSRLTKDVITKRKLFFNDIFEQIYSNQKYLIKFKKEKDFFQHCKCITGKEESVLIIPMKKEAILHLVYSKKEIVNETLANMLSGLSTKLSIAIKACIEHENIIAEIHKRIRTENELREKTAQLISSQEKAQKLYKDSEQARNTLSSILEDVVEKDSKLQISQKRFQDIVTNTGDWIWEIDEKGRYTYCSPVVKQVLGYEYKEVLGKYYYDFFVPEKKEEMKKAALISFTQKKPFKNFINRNIHKDGHEVILETSAIPLSNDKGDLKGYRGVDRDISERVQQEQIRETEIQLLDKLRGNKTIENCLKLGCKAIQKAGLFKRAVLTLHNKESEITHLGQVGLQIKLVEQARKASAPDMKLKKKIESEEFKVSHSFFIPEEAGLNFEQTERYIPQNKQSKIKTKDSWQPGDELFVPVISKDGITEGYLSVDTPFNGKRPDKRTILNLEDIVDIVTRQIHEIQNLEILRESESKYRLLAENTLDCVWKMDKDLKFTYINQSIFPMLGFTREEWTEGALMEHCSEKELQRFKNIVKDKLRKEDTYSAIFELNLFHKDGREIPLEILGKILLDENKDISGFQGNARDITERIQTENIQRALFNISNALNTTDKMRDLYNKIREYLGNVIDTTNFYVALFDEKTDMISLPFDVDEKDDFETFPAGKTLTSLVIKTGKPLFANSQLQDELNKQGKIDIIGTRSKIWLGVPLKIENKVMGVIVVQSYDDPNLYSEKDIDILTFISEEIALAIKHKQADENIQNAHKELKGLHKNLEKKVNKTVEELREKDHILIQQSRHAAMGEMIGNIAHQWRQPLAMVAAIIQNYEDAYEDGALDRDYIEKHTDLIMDILTKMSRTIDDFRYFFKPNKLKENFNIKNVINKTIKFLESSLKFNNIDVLLNLADDCIINGFQNEYSQVILVVLSNAKDELIERNIKNKKVTIILKKIEDKYVLKISDNAGGITKEVLPKIFDPYFTTKEQGKGTGVGLYMAKMIIEKNMDGKLTASNIKDGAEFRIEI